MVFSVTASVSTWVVFSIIMYMWHYFIEVYLDLPIIGQSPCTAHASLKLLIQRIIQEAIGLPQLETNDAEIEMANGEVINRTYEDLLATAILNKVIENYQDELVASRTNSVSSRMSNSSLGQNDKEYYFGAETLEAKWRNGTCSPAEIDAASVSSMDDWARSDSSVGSTKYVDHMSLTIQQRIEEVSSSDDEGKLKPVINKSLLPPENEWLENWHMQKRRIGSNASPVPVPMLVPNPSSEVKVLIGDRDAEDTTDLSDAGSDFGDAESTHSIEHLLTSSKKVIGGKNVLYSNGVKENVDFLLNGDYRNGEGKEDDSFMSIESQTEKDTEYTEKYATLPRTILKSPTPNALCVTENKSTSSPVNSEHTEGELDEIDGEIKIEPIRNQNGYHHEIESLYDEEDDAKDIFKGTYSEREKEKWNNAIEMKNNPYSSENLQRRLSDRSTGSIVALFGKDYYIKEAAKSTGSRNKLASNEDMPGQLTKTESLDESASPLSDEHIFTAKPALICSDTETLQTEVAPMGIASSISQSLLETSSDSDLSIERIYNLPSGNVYVNGKLNQTSSDDQFVTSKESKDVTIAETEQESIEKCMDFSFEYSGDESVGENKRHSEITDLHDKHLVKDLLGRFSISYPNLSTSQLKKGVEYGDPKHESTPNSKPVYSLTARSIPREFREELKRNEDTPRSSSSAAILDDFHTKTEESPTFPIAKNKIKFFESLKS